MVLLVLAGQTNYRVGDLDVVRRHDGMVKRDGMVSKQVGGDALEVERYVTGSKYIAMHYIYWEENKLPAALEA